MEHLTKDHERIKALRKRLKLSQKDFSGRIGISQGALSQIENGYSSISYETLRKICHTFSISCEWLVFGYTDREIRKDLFPEMAEVNKKGLNENQMAAFREVLPGLSSGDVKIFTVSGDEMDPVFSRGDLIITRQVREIDGSSNGKIMALVTLSNTIIVGRYYFFDEDAPVITAVFNHEDTPGKNFRPAEIKELWEIKAKITFDINRNADTHAYRLSKLQQDINGIKSDFDEVNQQTS